ncbi:MAG: AhpC/TSA family protein [Bacteroidetes bacterium]|nr:AhpC/TSA family protein [Bacteroidota bacterium]
MKNLLLFIIGFAMLAACSNQPEDKTLMTLNGTIDGDYNGMAYLYKRANGDWIKLDSALVENNAFVLTGHLEFPEMYYVSIDGENKFAGFFAEPSEITFKTTVDDFRNAEITGSTAQVEYNEYNEKMQLFNDMYSDLNRQYKEAKEAGDEEKMSELDKEFESVDVQMKQFILDNALSNNKSVVAAYAVSRNSYYFDENDLEPVVENFDPSIRESTYVKSLEDRVAVLKSVAIGQPAIDFTMDNMEGEPVTLSSLYGKYLLVDFWASWCGPCRRENPNVVAAYQEYKDKGFDILGVSFDRSKDKWMEAVKTDNLIWHHVSDLKYWGNKAGKLYGINSIPSNILLNPDGTIIAKNLRGEDLHNKLEELLD